MPSRGSKSGSKRFSFTSNSSTSSTSSNPPISRTATNNTVTSNPFSTSPTKTTAIHPHYCPAAYHSTPNPRAAAAAEAIELGTFDTDEHYWDNVRLNSHLSVDAWKTQSKVARKAAANANASAVHRRRRVASAKESEDDDNSDEAGSEASFSDRGRTQWRRSGRSSAGKAVVVEDVREQQRRKRAEGWKVRGLSWTVGLSGV